MTITIENLGPAAGTHQHQYILHINGRGHSTFQHHRANGLAACLRLAADAVDRGNAPEDRTARLDIDTLAQEIRRVDGNHSLGAGALAEALMPLILRLRHPELDETRTATCLEGIVRSAISRAVRAEVDPVLSFKITHRMSERDEAVKAACAAIRSL